MTRRKTESDTPPEAGAEQPAAGGSYMRQTDGSLKRVEFTADVDADIDGGATEPADNAGAVSGDNGNG